MSTQRICIFIDGSNFYHYMRGLGFTNLSEFNYTDFSNFLSRGRRVISSTYYIGKIRSNGDAKGEELRRGQQRFIARLQNAGWGVEFGHMLEHNGIFQEKGVDVHIAVDLLTGAYEDCYDIAVLVSSDTDLIPALAGVTHKGKQVEYVGFAHRPSFGLIKNANLTTLLRRDDIAGLLGGVH